MYNMKREDKIMAINDEIREQTRKMKTMTKKTACRIEPPRIDYLAPTLSVRLYFASA